MLILSRKIGEKIVLITKTGERIEIMPTKTSSDRVSIGVKADDNTKIFREEIEKEVKDAF